MKALWEIHKMPLYIATNVAIKPNGQSLIELANASGIMILKLNNFKQIIKEKIE